MKKRLGKGLDALFPDNRFVEENVSDPGEKSSNIIEIDVDKIKTSEHQPRKFFNDDDLKELAESIKNFGVIQPLVVKKEDDNFILIAGERRLRACKIIGLKKVPCIIRDDDRTSEIALIENIQRKDLNPYEEALSYKRLIDEYGYTQEELSQRLGISRSKIANSLRILNIGENIINMIINGELSEGHAKVLLSIEDEKEREKLANLSVEKKLSVRELEQIIKSRDENNKKESFVEDTIVKEIEENLMKLFGLKVKIVRKKKRGKIEIEFSDDEELEKIISILME